MNYSTIKYTDIANGTGVRVSLFVCGCRNNCDGCFNKNEQSFDFGEPFTKEVEDKIIEGLKPYYISGLSLLGGDPFEPENEEALIPFLKRVNKETGKTVWCYTGYKFEELVYRPMLDYIDVLVDGKFIKEKADKKLAFRGSSNQRIIRVIKC